LAQVRFTCPASGRACAPHAMASYIIAGKADDPAFARCEFAAKQIAVACPNVFFSFEMKHPDVWKEFIVDVFRRYDFDKYKDDFKGPLVWTHEGNLVGSTVEFVQKVCIEKFGIPDPPPATDPMFKAIASDNLKQVKMQQLRDKQGPPFAEICEAAHDRAQAAGLIEARRYDRQQRLVIGGASMEVWLLGGLAEEQAKIRQEYSEGQPAPIDVGLKVGIVGPEQSHVCLLHPQPLVRRQLVLVPQRHVEEDQSSPSTVKVPPSKFRANPDEDLGQLDFAAAAEMLTSVGGVATWSGIRGGSEYRHPLDTHIQVLPFPVHGAGNESPLRYPLELYIDRALRGTDKSQDEPSLRFFNFQHVLIPFPEGTRAADLHSVMLGAYEDARARSSGVAGSGEGILLAFTTSWLLLVPLMPPDVSSAKHEAWLRLPPPPPCALCGVVVCSPLERDFPETAGQSAEDTPLVCTRADQEGIPEGSPEFEAASREVRISTRILDCPAELVGVWARPREEAPRRTGGG